jgi:sirohydrochlorin cobaltochelatase
MNAPPPPSRIGVVLIGHGAPALDCPPQLIGELMSLEWRIGGAGHNHAAEGRAAELDAKIRSWPRRAGNDPYKEGIERVAKALRALLPTDLLAIGYNEFCRPTIAEAVDQVIRQGAGRVLVIPSMLTPGGVHAERDIPQALDEIRRAHPGIPIDYLWPFDLHDVASLLASHVRRALQPQP